MSHLLQSYSSSYVSEQPIDSLSSIEKNTMTLLKLKHQRSVMLFDNKDRKNAQKSKYIYEFLNEN